MADSIGVLLVDDIPLVRSGLESAFTRHQDVRVVGIAESGVHAIQLARQHRPDVILMDVSMPPGMSGVDAAKLISAEPELTEVKILMLSVHADDETVFEALRAGVRGFLLKDTAPEDIVRSVRTVAGGGSVLSPNLVRRVLTEFARRPAMLPHDGTALDRLTKREREVFDMLVGGYRNEEMAKVLVVGESTVKSHIQRLYDKLGVRDRVQVVIYAYEQGIISPGRASRVIVDSR